MSMEITSNSLEWRRSFTLCALLVVVLSLALYTVTLAPGLLGGADDLARNQTWAFQGSVDFFDVTSHPLWVYLAHIFIMLLWGDVAWRANLASAFFAVLTLFFIFMSSVSITKRLGISLLATATLAVSHTFWTYALLPKAYSLNSLFLAACVYLLLQWREKGRPVYLFVFAFLYGLSLLNHIMILLAGVGLIVFILVTVRSQGEMRDVGRLLLVSALLFCAGVIPFFYMLLSPGRGPAMGGQLLAFLVSLSYPLSHPASMIVALGEGISFALYQFPLTLFVGFAGLVRLWRLDRALFWLIVLAILGSCAFLMANLDPPVDATTSIFFQHSFSQALVYSLPAIVVFSLALPLGFGALFDAWCLRRPYRYIVVILLALALPATLYAAAPRVARLFLKEVPGIQTTALHDNFDYVLTPWKQNETGPHLYGEQILAVLPARAVLFADYRDLWIVRYMQVVEKSRPDVTLVEAFPNQKQQVSLMLRYHGDGREIYLVSTPNRVYELDGIQQNFTIVADGLYLQRLVPKDP